MIRGFSLLLPCLALASVVAHAEPLSRSTEIDFFRDAPSRSLKGFAARSDGRLVAGPALTELAGDAPADLFWSLAPTKDPAKWLLGTGPDGKIFEVSLDAKTRAFTTRELVKLDESHVFALAPLTDGSLLAGTSPKGALCLVRDGQQVARVGLPVDSIFDLLVLDGKTALAATGNPGRIYQIDLSKFAKAGVAAEKLTDQKQLADRGITLFAEIRDRNVRRLTRLSDGRIAAGSAPKGNIYTFEPAGAKADAPSHRPVVLQENRDAEVTDLLPAEDGGLFATLTFSGGSGEARITPGGRGNKDTAEPISLLPPAADRFSGRSSLVWIPGGGFPETLASRGNTAFYRVARHGDVLIVTGGEQGEVVGYDLKQRLSLTFAGSIASQLNGLASIPNQPGRFLAMRNNAPGFALIDFAGQDAREAETRRIDLGGPSQIGALRFNRLRDIAPNALQVSLRTSNGSDEIEGWSDWTALREHDGGWSAENLRGRYLKLRLTLPAAAATTAQIDKADLYALPQNRRPQLQEFRFLSANFALVPSPEPPPPVVVSLGQVIQSGNKDADAKQKGAFLGSQVVPAPGIQVVLWTVVDPDGDNLEVTFSLRRENEPAWTDIAVNSRDSYVQFDTSHFADGVYFTRLSVSEVAPRAPADRLSTTIETDDLIVDRTAPEILEASARREGDKLVVTVRGRDALSLVDGIEAIFNNGAREHTEQPVDGIRDSREETFSLEVPADRIAGATAVEVTLYDTVGNTRSRRLTW